MRADATVLERARIVVEVLSPRTRSYDPIEKRAAYRSLESLSAYVVIHTELRRVEVDRRGAGGSWRTETYDADEPYVDGRAIALDTLYARSSLANDTF